MRHMEYIAQGMGGIYMYNKQFVDLKFVEYNEKFSKYL